MKGHDKVIEYLNSSLRHELTAVSQYWLHYRLLDDWGFTNLAKKEREESIEEMEHADKLIERIIFLEGHPNLQTLDPLKIGQNIKEVLECDLAAEYSARKLYGEARAVCRSLICSKKSGSRITPSSRLYRPTRRKTSQVSRLRLRVLFSSGHPTIGRFAIALGAPLFLISGALFVCDRHRSPGV